MGCKLRPLLVATNPNGHKNQLVFKCETFCFSELCTTLFPTNAHNSTVNWYHQIKKLLKVTLGDGGHHGTGYVTPASAVQLVSKLCKLFDLMNLR